MSSGIYNYSQILRDKGERPFDPGDDYYIKLAIDHPGCGWIENYASFRYVCCNEGNLALFNADIDPSGGTVSGGGQDFLSYGSTHSFCIYTDIDNDGMFEVLDCSSSPNFSFPIVDGVEYWIVHRLITPCGEYCYIINFTTSPNFAMTSSSSLSCDDFPLPCNLTTPIVNCPNRVLGNSGVELRLNWNPVPMAASYDVFVIYDDVTCGCSGGGEGTNETGRSTGTNFDIPVTHRDMCFSYKVRANCIDGSTSEWSSPICYPDCLNGLQNEPNGVSARNDSNTTSPGTISLFPNPFNKELNISLTEFKSEKVTIQITNLQGKLIKVDYVNPLLVDNYIWRPSQFLMSGVYFITITSESFRETKKVVYTK